ncbi:M20 family metallopeptidase [Nonomuraea sp. NPDC005650]|uniref:M20 metallopeptidase family protein n=1 Tax=Nonomuraea sp. NPDC005650 TaxID=3157045 RepID=UPI0033B36DCF
MSLREAASELEPDLVRLRRAIHAEPELGLRVPRTRDKVLAELAGLPLEISTGVRADSVTAVLRGPRPGPVVLLRADMDALPLTERGPAGQVSAVPGRMHACGHDLHTAMLAGAARLLGRRRDDLPGNVIFMFQPGEEGQGGARIMIDEGVLDAAGARPAAAYALHVVSAGLPRGVVMTRSGRMMASCDVFEVVVRGVGGHGALWRLARDPVPALCDLVSAFRAVGAGHGERDPVAVTVGSVRAGASPNVIAEEARFSGTIRTLSERTRSAVRDRLAALTRNVAAAHGVGAALEFTAEYPMTVNDCRETRFLRSVVREALGAERFVAAAGPSLVSEDFSFVLEEVPGTIAILGACPPDRDPARAPYNHAPDAAFAESVLADGAALYAELALRRLTGPRTL